MTSNINDNVDWVNELLNYSHEDDNLPENDNLHKADNIDSTITEKVISEAINNDSALMEEAILEVIKQDALFIEASILEIKTYISLVVTRTNQINCALQNIKQVTLEIEKMKAEFAATFQIENKNLLLQKIIMCEISYVVITRAFLMSIEATEIAVINMVDKTITVAVMIASMDKTNTNAEKVVYELTELMKIWKKNTNDVETSTNAVMMFINSTPTPVNLLNLPDIIKAHTNEINKRTTYNTMISIVNQWISEY
jgi:hypothetical protein